MFCSCSKHLILINQSHYNGGMLITYYIIIFHSFLSFLFPITSVSQDFIISQDISATIIPHSFELSPYSIVYPVYFMLCFYFLAYSLFPQQFFADSDIPYFFYFSDFWRHLNCFYFLVYSLHFQPSSHFLVLNLFQSY